MRRLFTTMMCLSLFVCGTISARKNTMGQKKVEAFTKEDFKTEKNLGFAQNLIILKSATIKL